MMPCANPDIRLTCQKEDRKMTLTGPKLRCILLRNRRKKSRKKKSLKYGLSTSIPFYSTVVLEIPTTASERALESELSPHPGPSEIQCSSSFLFCLEVNMYPGLHRGRDHPPLQSHADSLWTISSLVSTNNNNNSVLQESRRQL